MSDCCCLMVVGAVVAAVALLLLILRFYIRQSATCPEFESMEGKTILLTGGTSGIGLATCEALVQRGARVVLGVRDPADPPPSLKPLLDENKIRLLPLDLATLDSVVAFAKEYYNSEERLDVIMHNAGILCPKEWTVDGLDQSLSVHCYGPVLLTLLLLDKLRGNPTVTRIIFTTIKPQTQEKFDLNDLDGRRFNPKRLYKWYSISKMVQLLLARDMSRRYRRDGITVYAAYPGLVNTGLFCQLPGLLGSLVRAMGPYILRSPRQGAQTLLFCASSPGIEPRSGGCFADCELLAKNVKGYDEDFEEKLWEKVVRTLLSKGFHSSLKAYKE